MELTRIDTIVQFTEGSAAVWNDVNVAVPAGAVVIDTVNKIVKEGDGVTLFASLPVCLDYNFSGGTSGAVDPSSGDMDGTVIASNGVYTPATTKLADLLSLVGTRESVNTSQQTSINTMVANNVVLTVSEGTVDGTIVVIAGGKYSAGNKTVTQLINDLIVNANAESNTMHIIDLEWYSDAGLTNKIVTPNDIFEHSTYYAKISGWHDSTELSNVDFGMTTVANNITITTAEDYDTCGILASIYGGTGEDHFQAVAIDSNNNIICAGYTYSEGTGSPTYSNALVVKFDSNLNILARKIYGGPTDDLFFGVAIDSNNNIICVGRTYSEGTGSPSYQNALVVKFDSNLNILARKLYGGPTDEVFWKVAVDSNDNIICAGYTNSEGTGSPTYLNALVVKFDSNLNILARKIYGGTTEDGFFGVTIDSNDNIICVGHTLSEGVGSPTYQNALVVKFDSNLNILARKIYGGTTEDGFWGVAIDSNDNIICAGHTHSEGVGSPSYHNALVVKFDSNLNILARKIYGGANHDVFNTVAIDSNDNIICAGHTLSEGTGSPSYQNALVVKFDSNLNILARKLYGGANDDNFRLVAIDSNNDIICAGSTSSEGLGGNEALVLKLPMDIPSGTFIGTTLTGLTLSDSNLTLAESALTLADSTLTLANSALTLADSTLTLAASTLTQETDITVAARNTIPTKLITAVYSSASPDKFNAATVDSAGNIICVGYSTIGSVPQAIVVKFDTNLNALARKIYSDGTTGIFNSVVTDASNNVICVGELDPSNNGITETVIVKLDSTLITVISHKTYGAAGTDTFKDVALDPSGNIICVGSTTSEGAGGVDALVVKFDSTLVILNKKRYGGTGNDELSSIAFDPSGNAICVGSTTSEGPNTSGLVLKLDSSLNIVLRKYYNSSNSSNTVFKSVTVSAASVIYCAGYVINTATSKHLGLIVKFDSFINVTANKTYGNAAGDTEFSGIKIDSADNIICAGKTNAEGAGDYDALVVKFTSTLAIAGRKTYGSVGVDSNIDCTVTSADDIVLSGYGVLTTDADAVVVKIPSILPEGLYTNKIFVSLILNDSHLTLADDSGTVNNSGLTMTDSNLTLVNSSLVLSNISGAVQRDVTMMDAVANIFKVNIGELATGLVPTPVVFNITTNDGVTPVSKNIEVNVNGIGILASIYGGTGYEEFISLATDSNDNIICVGYTYSEGVGSTTYINALVVKFDSNLNILARKIYGGAHHDLFRAVAIDSNDNIICVGYTHSEGVGSTTYANALVVKFNHDLTILARKIYSGANHDIFYGVVVDSNDNIICSGWTYSEGVGSPTYYNALVVKFDSNLNILARKLYGGASNAEGFRSVVVDSNDNIICSGYTYSEGTGSPTYMNALVVKFDSNLNILARKIYGGASHEEFIVVAIDSNDNIICAGYTHSEGVGSTTYYSAIVVKFDSNLNILARKLYGGANHDLFHGVAIDSNDNIICSGYTASEGVGAPNYNDALVVKFDSNLNILARKLYGGATNDIFWGVAIDSNDNIICVGLTASEGVGSSETLVLKLPTNIPSGTFVGTTLTGLTLTDSSLTLADSTLTLADSTLTLEASTLTLADSTLTLADSVLTAEKDTIMV